MDVIDALTALGEHLDTLVSDAGDEGWEARTPAQGWTVAHQIAHLAWTDHVSLDAIRDPDAFAATVEQAMGDPEGFVDTAANEWAATSRAALLDRWRTGRRGLADALREADPGERIPWFGPPMRPKSMATARVMETWAHATDVADGLGTGLEPGVEAAALPHVARIGHRTRDFAFRMNGIEPPSEPVRVILTGGGGEVHDLGPADAPQVVTGSLRDFCLLATQRVHRDDTDLATDSEDAERWLRLAQAFAGLPGGGRERGSRS